MAFVYINTKGENGDCFYIGIGVNKKRPYSKSNRNKHWLNTVNKYGIHYKIVVDNISFEEAKSWEKYLIGLYGRKDLKSGNLVNLTDGGDGSINVVMSEETKRLLSINNARYWKGKKRGEEFCKKMSQAHTGRKVSDEYKAILRERMKGAGNHYFGKKHSDEIRKKISERTKEALSKKNIDFSEKRKDKNVYNFVNEKLGVSLICSRERFVDLYNVHKNGLCSIITGKRISWKGWIVLFDIKKSFK